MLHRLQLPTGEEIPAWSIQYLLITNKLLTLHFTKEERMVCMICSDWEQEDDLLICKEATITPLLSDTAEVILQRRLELRDNMQVE